MTVAGNVVNRAGTLSISPVVATTKVITKLPVATIHDSLAYLLTQPDDKASIVCRQQIKRPSSLGRLSRFEQSSQLSPGMTGSTGRAVAVCRQHLCVIPIH